MKNWIRVFRAEPGRRASFPSGLGVSRQTVNAIENDRYDPSLPLAFAAAARPRHLHASEDDVDSESKQLRAS